MKNLTLSIFILLFIATSCQPHKIIKIDGFDDALFRKDRSGCDGNRTTMIDVLTKNKGKLLAVSENEIFTTLGRYDYQILDKKNEKAFVYYLEPGNQCLDIQNESTAKCLVVKFNAITLSKEVLILNGNEVK